MKVRTLPVLAVVLLALLPPSSSPALDLNEDGLAVVRLAADEYSRVTGETPLASDRRLVDYVNAVLARLIPPGTPLPKGVSVSAVVLDKAVPEVYSLANGKVVLTSGAVLALDNEAQLAAVLSHEAAHIVESHYPGIYQSFRARQKKERQKAAMAGLAGVVFESAVDYTAQVKTNKVYSDYEAGDLSYRKAMDRVSAIEAGQGVVQGFSEVYKGLPPETRAGSGDPRLPLEMLADSQGLALLVRAGYDPSQAGEAWRRLRQAADRTRGTDPEALARAFLPPHMRTLIGGVEDPMGNVRAEALTRTVSQNPPDRPDLLDALAKSKEVAALRKGDLRTGREEFRKVVGGSALADAKAAFQAGDWTTARRLFQASWDAGNRTAEVAYHLGRCQTGEFAFAASEREKEAGERYLLEATKLDPKMPEPCRALGDLYGDWERYEESAKWYRRYLLLFPEAPDRERVKRQIEKMERKAKR